jgi:hypothetical protein
MLAGPFRVVIGPGNRGAIDDLLGLIKDKVWIEIGVVVVAAIAGPETGVEIEIHQVGEPSDIGGPSHFTAGQIGKLIEVDRVSADRLQLGVDEGKVTFLGVSVVVDVLRHVAVKDLQRGDAERAAAVDLVLFGILGSSEFGVLLPQIDLQDFRGSQELQDGDVTPCYCGTFMAGFTQRRQTAAQDASAYGGGSSCDGAFFMNERRFEVPRIPGEKHKYERSY